MKQVTHSTKLIYFILFIFYSINSLSQNYALKGHVSTHDPNDIVIGNAFLMDSNNTIIQSAIVDNGSFSIASVEAGEYQLVITCFGFEKRTEQIHINENKTVSILLQQRTVNLNEVVVLGKKQLFTHKDGNVKISIDNPFFSTLPDLVTLLEKMPGVQVSPDQGSISIIGKGSPLIYIGNQQISVDELKSLSVDDIESVDIINNPPSKYEADGRAVILLTRKRKKQEGYKVSITERLAKKKYFNNNLSGNLSFLKNDFEFKANIEYNQLKVWEKNGFDFNIKDENIQSDYMTEAITTRPQFKMNIGTYYQINENQYISVDINGRPLYETYPIRTKTFINDQGQEDHILTKNQSRNSGLFYSGNLNYERKISDWNGKLFMGGQYSLFDKHIRSGINDTYQSTSQTFNRNRKQHYKVNAYSFKADYEHTFTNDINWEIGSKYVASNADTKTETTSKDVAEANDKSNYKYKESIYAVYTQLSGKIAGVSYSGGVRMEYTDIRRDFNMPKENYTKFFPKLSVGIPVDSTKSINLNYSKSVTRPNYSSSSQLDTYINPFYAISGNINLKPSTIDEVSINMQIKRVSFGLTYYQRRNPIYFKTEYDDDNKLLRLRHSNIDREDEFTVNLDLPFTYKSFSSTNSLIGIYNKVKDKSAVNSDTKPYLYYYSNNQFTLPKNVVLTLSGWGMTKRKEGIFNRNALTVIDLSLSKTFFDRLNCSLLFSDIFKAMKFEELFTLNNIASKGCFYADANAISLTLKYSFGKEKASKYKNEAIEENLYRMK